MKKSIVFAMAALMLFGALSAKAEENDDISRAITEGKIAAAEQAQQEEAMQADLTQGKIAAAEADMNERDTRDIQKMRLEIKRTLNRINSISEEINSRLNERFSSDLDKGDIAEGAAKIGTEVSTANDLVRELDARIATKSETDYVLKNLRVILSEVQMVNRNLQN